MKMERTENNYLNPQSINPVSEEQFDKDFKPVGAIAFFILLIILGAIIWYGIYFLMIERG
jgi:hypothetical protein